MFIYPIYNHNWRNISTIYIYIYIYKTRLASNEIFSTSNKIHRKVGRAKDLSALRYCEAKSGKLFEHVLCIMSNLVVPSVETWKVWNFKGFRLHARLVLLISFTASRFPLDKTCGIRDRNFAE